jgi:hypothetical protein
MDLGAFTKCGPHRRTFQATFADGGIESDTLSILVLPHGEDVDEPIIDDTSRES